MFVFPKDLYTDVRIEEVVEAYTDLKNGDLKDNKQRTYKGAFIRVFDGKRWYYSSTTNIGGINEEIKKLSEMATPNPDIDKHPAITRLEVNEECILKYENYSIKNISKKEQSNLLYVYEDTVKAYEEVKEYRFRYKGTYTKKHFYSSKGSQIVFDQQICGIMITYKINTSDKNFLNMYDHAASKFEALEGLQSEVKEKLEKDIAYIKEAVPVVPGKYTVIFSPMATGIFAHESFGHKSEADLMLGSEVMKEEWKIGKRVGSEILSIIDQGDIEGSGYVPYDDEGNRARKNYVIEEGILKGRLHSGMTASILQEEITANARSMNFEYEPIVRMTTTYIDKGELTKDELFAGVKEGIYVEDVAHGSGMSTFTIAPQKAYMIRDGKIAEPITVSVVTGNVMETLYQIDGISDEVKLQSFVAGGCGKMEQYPLPVGFGGPYIRVQNLGVQ